MKYGNVAEIKKYYNGDVVRQEFHSEERLKVNDYSEILKEFSKLLDDLESKSIREFELKVETRPDYKIKAITVNKIRIVE